MTKPHPIKSPRKLIEVALPLDAINAASAREKSIRHGHPSTLHLWWARRPLAAARAVIFAQLVNDPGFQVGGGFRYGKNKKEAALERRRLFQILEELVKWESTGDQAVLQAAQVEIQRSWREVCELNRDHPDAASLFDPTRTPSLHDPFSGGGSIPLEAQRLGLHALASDLNPVAVIINKASIEIPPRFAGRSPIGPMLSGAQLTSATWPGATGLAEDVRRYGTWIRDEAARRIGHLYPTVEITRQIVRDRPDLSGLEGQKLTVIAWLWARTVRSPNPAFSHLNVPLISNYVLASKPGKEAYVEPRIDHDKYSFTVKPTMPPAGALEGTKAKGRGANFVCIMSGAVISAEYIRGEARAGRMGTRLLAIVAEGQRGRIYLSPDDENEAIAKSAEPKWQPDVSFFQEALGFRVGNYGMTKWSDVFTSRQLLALTTFSDLTIEVRERIRADAVASGYRDDGVGLSVGGDGAQAYAEAVSVYLAFAVDRSADFWSSLCVWANQPKNELVSHVFTRQTLSMTWDFAEASPFSESGGNFLKNLDYVAKGVATLPALRHAPNGLAYQMDAATTRSEFQNSVIATDPPYYDNIGYADLSDFFYVWLRRNLREVYPEIFSTVSTPKAEELVATPARHGGKSNAESFFLDGMTSAMSQRALAAHPALPLTLFYAFKQSETNSEDETTSTGWQTFLEALFRAGLMLSGTWPMRTEREARSRGIASNALASSIVLVCRRRPTDAPTVSRREFLRDLNVVLPEALDEMTKGAGDDRSPVAPVDLSQAIIGPGMAVFSKYAAVLEADGTPMTVKTALQLINRFLAEDDFDRDTQFCLHWFDQHAWDEGPFGEADVLARAKATSVGGLEEAGVARGGAGKLRLLRPAEYPADWDPRKDTRLPIWEALHQLVRALRTGGEPAAGALLAYLKDKAESIRQLAYRLYTLCERRGMAEDAGGYNDLVKAWTAIEAVAPEAPPAQLNIPGVDS